MPEALNDYVEFQDSGLKARYSDGKIPMGQFVESYIDEKLNIKGDLQDILRKRSLFVNYRITPDQVKFLATKFIPSVLIHSKAADKDMVTTHYDRGNDFFEAFLAETMVYTSGFFKDPSDSLEDAQFQKLDYVGKKIQVKPGEKLLDIGCGWGTLVAHMAEHFGADATGVTLSKNQVEFGMARIQKKKLADKARMLVMDYRDIPRTTYDKITVLEMAEHVGIKNFQKFMKQLYGMLADDGLFYLQIAGLRRNWNPEDFTWGLFMSKYIFPGADASMPLSYVTNQLEKAGFEIHSVENIGIHYSLTINQWYKNWLRNKEAILKAYGERWFRLWETFLAWSVLIAAQGGSTAFQIVANKNVSGFDRNRWINEEVGLGEFAAQKEKKGQKRVAAGAARTTRASSKQSE